MIDPAYFLSPLIWYILICLHLSIHTTVFEHMTAFVQYCECVCVFWAYEECALKKGAHCAYGAHGREVCGSSGGETLISRVKRQKKVLLLCFGRTEAYTHSQRQQRSQLFEIDEGKGMEIGQFSSVLWFFPPSAAALSFSFSYMLCFDKISVHCRNFLV